MRRAFETQIPSSETRQRDAASAALEPLAPLARALLDATPEGQCVMDEAGRLRGANSRLLEMVGCQSEADLVGVHVLTVFPLLQRLGPEAVESALAGHAVRGTLEQLRPEQAPQSFEVSLSPLVTNDGVLGALLTLREHVAAGPIVARLADLHRLELSARVACGAAHDLSDMLTVIHAEAARALMLSLDGEVSDSLEAIRGCAEQSGRLVRKILTLAAGDGEPSRSFALKELVGRLEELFARYQGPSRELVLEMPADFVGRVTGQRSRIEQALFSLVLTAAEAAGSGGAVRVLIDSVQLGSGQDELSLARRLPAGTYCRFRVVATGEGLDGCGQEQLCQPLVQPKETCELGLYATRSIIESLGGALYVEPAHGHSTTVGVLLPGGDQGGDQTLVPTVRPARPALALAKTRIPDSDRPRSAPPRTGSEG